VEYNGLNEKYEVNVPSYILVVGRAPTQAEIDIAAEFNIPIRMFNIKKYNQVDYRSIPRSLEEQYEYSLFIKDDVSSRQKEIDKNDDAKMM